MNFTDQLRAIDDANLDAYQFRLVMHYWRVGQCWETIRTTAEKCGMSGAMVHKTRNWLLENGWIEWQVVQDKYGQERMAIVLCSLYEQTQQLDGSSSSPDEQGVHDMNEMFTEETKRSPHEQEPVVVVHDMNAILNEPNILNEPKEDTDPPTPRKKPKQLTADDFEIPESLDSSEFRELFNEWILMRAETKKLRPVTLRAGKMQLKLLIPFGRVWAINRLKKGIASQWAGLVFDDDIPGTSHSQNGHAPEKKKLPGQTEYGW